jgi:hypothetical protein
MTKAKDKVPAEPANTKRQRRYLDGLAERQGKRLPVDLDGEEVAMVEALVDADYGRSQGGVLRRALREAHKKNVRVSSKKT